MAGLDLASGAPLALHPDGRPLVYPVLAVELYLEPPVPDQVELYEQATAMIADWIGGELKWTHMSTLGEPEAHDPADFSHLVEHVRSRVPPDDTDDPEHIAEGVHRLMKGEFAL